MQYLLDTCTTVEEVIAAQERVRISNTQEHFLVLDRTGACAAIEFLDGELVFAEGIVLTDGAVPVVVTTWENITDVDICGLAINPEGSGPVGLDELPSGTVIPPGGTIDVQLPEGPVVVEAYDCDGRAVADSGGGALTISSKLEYGTLASKKRGDTILSKSFILGSAKDEKGKLVTMRKRTTRDVIPQERGLKVVFTVQRDSLPTTYTYRVQWDVRKRTRPSGRIEVGTWKIELPKPRESGKGKEKGRTHAQSLSQPIPRLKTR